ncbi:MAG: hypothetical protein QOJ65_1132 [Fimbriimonadaceae bacterium]|jgi:hypothetical protein|nr:hypothetical protein [Fimbriimonadaceae bacterium]
MIRAPIEKPKPFAADAENLRVVSPAPPDRRRSMPDARRPPLRLRGWFVPRRRRGRTVDEAFHRRLYNYRSLAKSTHRSGGGGIGGKPFVIPSESAREGSDRNLRPPSNRHSTVVRGPCRCVVVVKPTTRPSRPPSGDLRFTIYIPPTPNTQYPIPHTQHPLRYSHTMKS